MHARMRDAVRRMLRSMFAAGLFDDPPTIEPLDVAAGDAVARDAAAAGIVLLKNDGVLPLLRSAQRVAVIGGFAHAGVMSGGGSSQVEPAAGPAITFQPAEARRNIEIHPVAAARRHQGPAARRTRESASTTAIRRRVPPRSPRTRTSPLCSPRSGCRKASTPRTFRCRRARRGDRRRCGGEPPNRRRSRDRRPGADAVARRCVRRAGSLVSGLERRRGRCRRAVRRRESGGAAADHLSGLARAIAAAEARRYVGSQLAISARNPMRCKDSTWTTRSRAPTSAIAGSRAREQSRCFRLATGSATRASAIRISK